jgi:hypothetical protein
MRENELDPQEDMTEEWEAELQAIIDEEFNFVEQFINDIVSRSRNDEGLDALLTRVPLWANRYNDVVNQSKIITASKGQKLEWVYGDTEHCATCAALNGIVAYATEWEESGFHPQGPPNDLLSCGGWRCQCELRPTDRRRSANALTRLLDLAVGQNL